MSSKRAFEPDASTLERAWTAYGDDTFNLHNVLPQALLDDLRWIKPGDGYLCVTKDADTNEDEVATWLAICRFSSGKTSFKFTEDGLFTGQFGLVKHKLAADGGRPWDEDSIDAMNIPSTWPTVLDNVDKIIGTRYNGMDDASKDTHPVTSFVKDGALKFTHKLFMPKDEFERLRADMPTSNEAPGIYDPIDTSSNPVLTLAGWPWPEDSNVPGKLRTLPTNTVINPLPAYDADGKLLMPSEYVKLKGALVLVHFTIVWSRIGAERKNMFTADVARIDLLQKPRLLSPKKRRVGIVQKEPTSPTRASGSGTSSAA